MTTLFISDLHLDAARPAIIDLFERFITEEAVHADALYILGDLFDAWIGDDAVDDVGRRFVNALAPMREAHKPVFFMHGNRDFLIGPEFARQAGLTLLPDPSVIDLYGTRTLLMHGDSLCTDDVPYQAFRKLSRSPQWQRAFLARPIEERQAFARQARGESQRYTSVESHLMLLDVNLDEAIKLKNLESSSTMIHGHTHRPNIHQTQIGKEIFSRAVLEDWHSHGMAYLVQKPESQNSMLRILPRLFEA